MNLKKKQILPSRDKAKRTQRIKYLFPVTHTLFMFDFSIFYTLNLERGRKKSVCIRIPRRKSVTKSSTTKLFREKTNPKPGLK